jgi:hypothetical protein
MINNRLVVVRCAQPTECGNRMLVQEKVDDLRNQYQVLKGDLMVFADMT